MDKSSSNSNSALNEENNVLTSGQINKIDQVEDADSSFAEMRVENSLPTLNEELKTNTLTQVLDMDEMEKNDSLNNADSVPSVCSAYQFEEELSDSAQFEDAFSDTSKWFLSNLKPIYNPIHNAFNIFKSKQNVNTVQTFNENEYIGLYDMMWEALYLYTSKNNLQTIFITQL